eukprot:4522830-Pleurochrysis_carterae.AAC.1
MSARVACTSAQRLRARVMHVHAPVVCVCMRTAACERACERACRTSPMRCGTDSPMKRANAACALASTRSRSVGDSLHMVGSCETRKTRARERCQKRRHSNGVGRR